MIWTVTEGGPAGSSGAALYQALHTPASMRCSRPSEGPRWASDALRVRGDRSSRAPEWQRQDRGQHGVGSRGDTDTCCGSSLVLHRSGPFQSPCLRGEEGSGDECREDVAQTLPAATNLALFLHGSSLVLLLSPIPNHCGLAAYHGALFWPGLLWFIFGTRI